MCIICLRTDESILKIWIFNWNKHSFSGSFPVAGIIIILEIYDSEKEEKSEVPFNFFLYFPVFSSSKENVPQNEYFLIYFFRLFN